MLTSPKRQIGFLVKYSDQQLLQNSLKTFRRIMLSINNATDNITLLRRLQFNPQSLKCLIRCSFNNRMIHCFVYVRSNTYSRKGFWSKVKVILRNIWVEIRNIIINSSF